MPDLPFEILERYGKALGYDFTSDFPEMVKERVFTQTYIQNKTAEELIAELGEYKEKYTRLLEKYNELLEEKKENLNR